MAHYSYDRLAALDTSFLILEKPNGYTHVASTQIFEAGPLRTEDGGIDFEADLVPDLPEFVAALQDASASLSALAVESAAAQRGARRARRGAPDGASA